MHQRQAKLTIAAVGDISFTGHWRDTPRFDAFDQISSIFNKSDIVVANLEGPLYNENHSVPGKCTIRGNTSWAAILKKAGVSIVSLANNHMMDHGESGLFSTISALKEENIEYVGAGDNIREASKPLFKEVNGYRIAFLARTSVIVTSPSCAGENTPGVAFLCLEELLDTMRDCRNKADLVILLMHWGLEHYEYPNPEQRAIAKSLIGAGGDIVIGHHPHVLQGFERLGDGVVAYSIGNFLFNDFEWEVEIEDGVTRRMTLKMFPDNRRSVILKFVYKQGKFNLMPVFTRIDNETGVVLDPDLHRARAFELLSKRLGCPFYSRWWKLYALKKEWELRFSSRFTLKNLSLKWLKIRPKHFKETVKMIRKSLRVSSGNSTNPYE